MSSFFADLMISTGMMSSIVAAVEKSRDIKREMLKAIGYPFREATQTKCSSKSGKEECEHEKPGYCPNIFIIP